MTRSPSNEEKRDFAARKFRWLEKLARDRELSALTIAVCIELCHLFNLARGGAAWPWQDEIAEALGTWREKVNRALAQAVERGHLRSVRRGRNRANAYYMVEDASAQDVTETVTSSDQHDVTETVTSSKLRCDQNRDLDVTDSVTGMCRNRSHRVSSKKTPTTTGRKDSLPPVASLGRKKARKGLAAGRVNPEAEPNRDAETADAFPRFWAVYPNHQNEKLARKAFARAEIDTDPEIIIGGAQRYALAEQLRLSRPGQTAQHTAHAHNWLDAQRWNDPPPPGLVVDEAGHPLAIEEDAHEDTRDPLEIVMAEAPQLWPDWK